MRLADIPQLMVDDLHFMNSHWKSKQDLVNGCILIDNTNNEQYSTLNTPDVKARGILRYGKKILPPIVEVFE